MRRIGNKMATMIIGLEQLDGIDVKKTAKLCASKFACGCSISKDPPYEGAVAIQGDVCEESKEFLIKMYPDKLNPDNVIIEKSKK